MTGDFQDWNGVRAPSITRLNAEGQMDVEFTENLRPIFGLSTTTTITSTNVGGVWVSVTNVVVSYVISPCWVGKGIRGWRGFRTRPGRRYFMEATGDPGASTWVEVGSVDGDGTAKPFSVSSVDHRFYRMRITDR